MKTLYKRIIVGLTALAITAGLPIALTQPASAAPSCASGRICIWDTSSYGGSTLSMTSPGAGNCKTIPNAWAKNMMSSSYNTLGRAIMWYDGDGCSSFLFTQFIGEYMATPAPHSNKANSFRVQ